MKVIPVFVHNENWYSPIYQFEVEPGILENKHSLLGFDDKTVEVYDTRQEFVVDTPGGVIKTSVVKVSA